MNTKLISFLVGGSFGVFLAVQYVIFVLFLSKRYEIKKSREDLFYIILIGCATALSGTSGFLSATLDSELLRGLFRRIEMISAVLNITFFVMLLRYIFISIKDMTFVETDDYKTNTKRYLVGYSIVSFLAICFISFINTDDGGSGRLNYLKVPVLAYLVIVLAVETFQFRGILKKEIGKITRVNFLRYVFIYSSGAFSILALIAEAITYFFNSQNALSFTGSYYMYGLIFMTLGLSFNMIFEYMEVMTRMNETNRKLTDLNRKIMEDVRTAQSLQISLLPLDKQKIIQNYIDMEISYMPMQSVGGDYYDFYMLNENQVLLFLGDASGHGVYAAMIWAMLKVEVEELIEDKQFDDLSQAFTILNQRITRILENTYSYATLFSCLIDLKTHCVSYISAGHTDQLYFSSEGNAVNRIRNKNPIIGTFKNAKFTADNISCRPGDMILLFSDGIVEGTNPDGEQLGKERLENMFLEASNDSGNASFIIGNMLIKLEEFFEGSMQKDDRTLMVIRL